jgi:hypothetical protein
MPPPDYGARFVAADLLRFFTAVDVNLTQPATLTAIGGSAIALYGVSSGTMDIDTWGRIVEPIEHAIAKARVVTGLNIPVAPAAVADIPWHAEDRLRPEVRGWTFLTVKKLEEHDLALSKAVRGDERDLAAIEALHRIVPLDRDTLVRRYLEEMTHAVGEPVRLDERFVLLIERLYGLVEADRVERRLKALRKR